MNGNRAASRLYKFETEALGANYIPDQRIGVLRTLARRVWHQTNSVGRLRLMFGLGMLRYNEPISFTEIVPGGHEITLIAGERNAIILLHEIAHCMGPRTHGADFTRLYIDLLALYTSHSRVYLEREAITHRIAGYELGRNGRGPSQ